MNQQKQKTLTKKIQVQIEEFRSKIDEQSLTDDEHYAILKRSKQMHSHIDYQKAIADLEFKYKNAKPEDKANYLAVLKISKQQMEAGYGKK